MGEQIVTGHVHQDSTAVAVDIELGFVPKAVKVTNWSTGSVMWWNDKMEDGHALVEAATATVSTAPVVAHTLGITPIAGDYCTHPGFRIGLHTKINIASQDMLWEAHR